MADKTLADALALAQGEFKQIKKDKTAKIKTKTGGEYAYQYADFADVLSMALPALAKNGLAFTQPLRFRDGQLFVTSEVLYGTEKLVSDGIPIKYELMSPQEFGSCLTYWRRYDGCSLLGIQPDKDDDGQIAQESHKGVARAQAEKRFDDQRISVVNVREFWKEARKTGHTNDQVAAFLGEFGYTQTEEIKQSDYDRFMEWAKKPVPVLQDLLPALNESLDMAKAKRAPVEAKKPSPDGFWKQFWVTAKKHGIPESDIHRYAVENFGIKASLTELNPADIGKLVAWITSVEP